MKSENTPDASEASVFSRTSVTVDEAIAILLGWAKGPMELVSNNDDPSKEEEAVIDAYLFDLDDRIRDIREGLDSDLLWAEHDGPPSEAERLRSELSKLKETETRAYAYRCAIEDELSKGEASALRKDLLLSNNGFPYITLASLDQWARKHYERRFLATTTQSSQESLSPSSAEAPKPRTRLRDQEKAILAGISDLGYDPKQLPKNSPGKDGVKKQVRVRLAENSLFEGTTVFDRAWERLRKDGDIADN